MKRIVFYLMVLVIALSSGCNSGNQNNSQQAPAQGEGMAPGGGIGQGREVWDKVILTRLLPWLTVRFNK